MKINPRSHIPIYLQIAEGIREAVAAGVYLIDEPLPSLRALALEIQVNPNTVQRAYDELAREGLIYAKRGRGLFVAEQGEESAQSVAQQTIAEQAVQNAFQEGIRAGRAAGMTLKQLRSLFSASLNESTKQETKT